jgi:hypothetical protein
VAPKNPRERDRALVSGEGRCKLGR